MSDSVVLFGNRTSKEGVCVVVYTGDTSCMVTNLWFGYLFRGRCCIRRSVPVVLTGKQNVNCFRVCWIMFCMC